MLLRLMGWWLATALLALAVMTAFHRQYQFDRMLRLAEAVATVSARDWAADFEPNLEPNRAVDAMPGLTVAVARLVEPHLGLVAAGLALPSGALVAARGSAAGLDALTARATDGVETAWDGASPLRASRVHPSHATPVGDGTRLLWAPLFDWTGLVRARLGVVFRVAPSEPAARWPWRWGDVAGALIGAAFLGGLGWRSGWRVMGPLTSVGLPTGLMAALLTASALSTAIGDAQDFDVSAGALLAHLASHLASASVPGSAADLCARWRRSAVFPPPSDCQETPARDGARRHDSQPGPAGRLVPHLVLKSPLRSQETWAALATDEVIALVATLFVASCLPALLPRPWRRVSWAWDEPPERSADDVRKAALARLFLLAAAVTGAWPALRSEVAARPAPLLIGLELMAAAAGAALGAHVSRRHGWRVAALPSGATALAGAAVLAGAGAPLLAIVGYGVLGLGSGGTAAAIATEASLFRVSGTMARRGRELLRHFAAGAVAGLACGWAARLGGGDVGWRVALVGLWLATLLSLLLSKNDAAAPLRHILSKLEQRQRGAVRSAVAEAVPIASRAALALLLLAVVQALCAAMAAWLDLGRDSAHAVSLGLSFH